MVAYRACPYATSVAVHALPSQFGTYLCEVGYGVARDTERAERLAKLAMRVLQRQYLGLRPEHLLARAMCYREGLGTEMSAEREKQLLKRAKEQGDYLIVALSTDEFNWDCKQKKCY